jgi:putative CocE/NonD family hydrolase
MPPVPVDEDTDGSMAAAAQSEHQGNASLLPLIQAAPFRDNELQPGITHQENAPYRFIDEIHRSGVAVYHIGGWYDGWARDEAVWFNNLTVPQRLLLTPFSHQIGYDAGWLEDITPLVHDNFSPDAITAFQLAEHLRFFDYHLKGIDNGIMDEPPVWYYTMGAAEGEAWRFAASWPLPNERRTNFYLGGDAAQSVHSVNDGLLSTSAPSDAEGNDNYTVDYTTSLGVATRWTNMYGGAFGYGDMTANDEKALTFTTPVLSDNVEVTGHPVVHLWVTSTADDGDFFVYLSEVDDDGYTHYITEGALRASHRALSEAPYNDLGLPYHRSFEEDFQPLPAGEPVELVFDLLPLSNIFDAGHRIRVTIMGADADTFATPQLDPAPTVSIYLSASHASYIDLPIIPAE